MILRKTLLSRLDKMLDEAIAGTFQSGSYDEKLISKIESKTIRFLEQSKLKREQIEGERERVHSLISDISHQTKTPLSNITLYTQLLAEQDLTGEQKLLTAQISDNTEKLDFLISSLVKTSRLENGIISVRAKNGNVYDLVSFAVFECEKTAAEKDITLSFTRGENPVTALFDIKWCGEALVNIIDNAVKYSEGKSVIKISVHEYEMFARIDIEDDGRGIREEDIPKVFMRFWRAAESSEKPGVGVGLFIARQIITACGGYIKVSSRYGQGSVFSVFLSKVLEF